MFITLQRRWIYDHVLYCCYLLILTTKYSLVLSDCGVVYRDVFKILENKQTAYFLKFIYYYFFFFFAFRFTSNLTYLHSLSIISSSSRYLDIRQSSSFKVTCWLKKDVLLLDYDNGNKKKNVCNLIILEINAL